MIEKELLQKIKKDIFNGDKKLPITGFNDLDLCLGNIEKDALIVIGSRPAMGKTSFMTQVALNLLRLNKKCLYLSLEMSNILLIKTFISKISKVDSTLLKHAETLDAEEWSRIDNAISEIENFDLEIFDESANIDKIKEIVETEKPQYVFIDYLQLIEMPSKKDRTIAVDDVMKKLKLIAKENDCIIFIASQLSRKLEERMGKRPLLSDLRESGSIENIADVVMFIYREEYYNKENPEYKGEAEVIVAKNKMGPTGMVRMLFNAPTREFFERVLKIDD